jgi:putative ABC transport system permease protein
MMWLSFRMLRSRWPVFIGTFLALTLGICLMATTLLCIAAAGSSGGTEEEEWLRSVAITLLGNAAGVSGAAAIFVVTGTFSFATVLRRREFALLRAIGATPRQIRQLVLGESVVIGLAAAAVGCLLSLLAAPAFAHWMASVELAPPGFAPHITWWPFVIAAVVGLISAVLSALAASRRASAVRPIEALIGAAIETRIMTPIRWIGALIFLGGAALLIPVVANAPSGVDAAYILLEILLLLFGLMMLMPLYTIALTRIVSLPMRSVIGRLATANILTGLRRTNATIAPIFITIALAAASFSSVATLSEIRTHTTRDRVTAPLIVSADDGLNATTLAALQQAEQGTHIEPVTQSTLFLKQGADPNSEGVQALYVQSTIPQAIRLPVAAGAIADLSQEAAIAVSQRTAAANNWQLGQQIHLWTANDVAITPTLVALVEDSDDLGSTLLLSRSIQRTAEPDLTPQLAYVVPQPGTDAARLQSALKPIAAAHSASILPTAEFLAEIDAQDARIDRIALLTVVGLAILYTALSIINTCIMSVTGRFRDFAVLQLSGASRRQILTMMVIETCLITGIAIVVAALVTVAAVGIIFATSSDPHLAIPWTEIIAVTVACLTIALITSIISTRWAFRIPAIRIAAARE